MITDATKFTDPSFDRDQMQAIAQAIVGGLQDAMPKGTREPVPAQEPSWTIFAGALDQLVSSNPELKRTLEETAAHTARQALAIGDGPAPSKAEFLRMLREPAVIGKGGSVARPYWWGFSFYVSHEDLSVFLLTAVPLTTITAALVASLTGPLAPYVVAIAAFVTAILGLLKVLDRGRGIYINMSWFCPGVFVPTTA